MLSDSGSAPYAPAKAVLLILDQYRDKFLPTPVTTTTLERAGVERSLSQRTLTSLKQLDLVDETGMPTDTFEKIRTAPTDQLTAVLADWVRCEYAAIFQYVNADDPVQRIADQFRHYTPPGQRNRMVTLFLGLCVRAGILNEMPALPRGGTPRLPNNGNQAKQAMATTKAAKAAKTISHTPTPTKFPTRLGDADPKTRYVQLLIAMAEAMETPDTELLDRIERVLGIRGDTS